MGKEISSEFLVLHERQREILTSFLFFFESKESVDTDFCCISNKLMASVQLVSVGALWNVYVGVCLGNNGTGQTVL